MFRAVSLVGRALPWHGRGQEFESPTVHQKIFGLASDSNAAASGGERGGVDGRVSRREPVTEAPTVHQFFKKAKKETPLSGVSFSIRSPNLLFGQWFYRFFFADINQGFLLLRFLILSS